MVKKVLTWMIITLLCTYPVSALAEGLYPYTPETTAGLTKDDNNILWTAKGQPVFEGIGAAVVVPKFYHYAVKDEHCNILGYPCSLNLLIDPIRQKSIGIIRTPQSNSTVKKQ